MELFDSATTLRKLLPKLLRGYALDAIDVGDSNPEMLSETNPMHVNDFLYTIRRASGQQFPAIGLGKDIRLAGEHVTAAALVVGGKVIHLSAFPGEDRQKESPRNASSRRHNQHPRIRRRWTDE
jgi:hypothetical protein